MSLRDLPSVDRLTNELGDDRVPRSVVVEVVRQAIEEARREIAGGGSVSAKELAVAALDRLARNQPSTVINATGVLLHTNLGRANLSQAAVAAAAAAGGAYSSIELDRASGERGPRSSYLRHLAALLTGAEEALVVNNNAGALFLVLIALAGGRPVPVSRGEMIEIGGSYRLPELLAASGAILIEIGTTNRTRIDDYRATLPQQPALFLKVHPSNYRIEGFTEAAALEALVALGQEAGVPVVFDAGSGLLDQNTPWLPGPPPEWLAGEPGIRQAVAAGADLVLFSGDKLLGGPQAGIIVGRAELVGRLARHPVARALRIDAATDAALAATIEAYGSGEALRLPLWQMATADRGSLHLRCRAVLDGAGIEGEIVEGASAPGGGSAPGTAIPGPVLRLEAPQSAFHLLLAAEPPILTRRQGGHLYLDLRTVPPEADRHLMDALRSACRS
jgi:L-seryl-tRNA(Ser) seleniumtransferase